MPKTTHRLTAIKVQKLKTAGMHPDGAGLYLKVNPSGSKSYVLRYMLNCSARYLGLGSASMVSLVKAPRVGRRGSGAATARHRPD